MFQSAKKYIVSNALFDKCLKLRKGAQVMCIANVDMDNGIYNGSQGIIRGFNEEGKPIVHFANGVERAIGPHTWLSENISGMGVSQIPPQQQPFIRHPILPIESPIIMQGARISRVAKTGS